MWSDSGYISLALPVLVAFPLWYWVKKSSKNVLPYPPGPKPYPLIGNLLDFPLNIPPWEGLKEMAEQHGQSLPRIVDFTVETLIVEPLES